MSQGEEYLIPKIARNDYESFRRLIDADLPETYGEWLNLFVDELEEARRQGKTVIEIRVEYDEFIRHCRATGQKPDALILLDFAERKKAGRKD